jgi:hypothetical protein
MCGQMSPKRGGSKISGGLRAMLELSLKDDLIITNAYEEWLDRNPDGTITPEAAAVVAAQMVKPDRDRSGSFSASQAGTCFRRQELSFLGVPKVGVTGEKLRRIFNNGRWVHLKWQAQLLSAGIIDAIEVDVKSPKLKARCTLDGMGVATRGRYQGQDFGLEIKGRNDYTYMQQAKGEPDESTRRQVDFQFLMTGFDVKVILNENKNDQTYKEWVIYRDEGRVHDARIELQELSRAIDKQRLHPMIPECRRQEGEFDKCQFGGNGGPCMMAGTWPSRVVGS